MAKTTYEPLDDDNKVDRELALLIRAKFPILSVVTYEEQRVMAQLEGIRDEIIAQREAILKRQIELAATEEEKESLVRRQSNLKNAHQILRWSSTDGIIHWSHYDIDPQGERRRRKRKLELPIEDSRNPVQVLNYLRLHSNDRVDDVDLSTALFVFCDLHPWLDREDRMGRFNHMLVRLLRDLAQIFKLSDEPRSLILISPRSVVPVELRKEIQVIDYPLPTIKQLHRRFETMYVPAMKKRYGENCIRLSDEERERLMRALSGLTYEEAENVLAKSLVNNGWLEESDIDEALSEKRQIIRKDGTLEYFEASENFDQVGGLELLLQWLEQRKAAFSGKIVTLEGKEIELPMPKGILMIGVPGGGKSLVAKVVANAWRLPLLRLDIGRIFGGIVGQSEENMRRAIRIAESISPAVLWVDEVEKAFPKTSGASDSGVALRVMGTFLSWMQEKKEPVFVIATGNDISQLPPELTRKGRFDEIFYVGLPNEAARLKIFEIHTHGLPLSNDDLIFLAHKARWYTGAEIEQVVKNSFFALPFFLSPEAPIAEAGEPGNPLARAIYASMKTFVPLAGRRGADGRGLLATTLETAKAIATPASKDFEQLPGEAARAQTEGNSAAAGFPAEGNRW